MWMQSLIHRSATTKTHLFTFVVVVVINNGWTRRAIHWHTTINGYLKGNINRSVNRHDLRWCSFVYDWIIPSVSQAKKSKEKQKKKKRKRSNRSCVMQSLVRLGLCAKREFNSIYVLKEHVGVRCCACMLYVCESTEYKRIVSFGQSKVRKKNIRKNQALYITRSVYTFHLHTNSYRIYWSAHKSPLHFNHLCVLCMQH